MAESFANVAGLASGIQWNDMIDQLVQIQTAQQVTPIATQITARQTATAAWTNFSTKLSALAAAAAPLRDGTAFNSFKVTAGSSPTTGKPLFSATASSTAAPGSYGVEVEQLATSDKLGGAAVADTSAALGYSGTFYVNGKAVTLASTDSLVAVRDKINAANGGTSPTGVTASIVNVSDTEHYLTLTADATGERGIELVDSASGGGVLSQLGLVGTTTTANDSPTDATRQQTQRFGSQTTAITQMLGLPTPPYTASILVNGTAVNIDLQNDTLQDVLDKIQAADASARMVTEKVGGKDTYRIEATGVTVDSTDANSQRISELLGFQKAAPTNSIQTGQNAKLAIDQYQITRRTNTVSDALPGVTLDLQTAEPGQAVNLSIGRDLDGTAASVQKFADAFNDVVAFVNTQRKPDAPLYGSGAVRSMLTTLKDVLLNDVGGIDKGATSFYRTALTGVTLTKDGTLDVDKTALESALTTNFSEVRALFGTGGTSSNAALSFATSTDATKAGIYSVEITRAATTASHAEAFSGPYADTGSNANTMTITDGYTGATGSISLAGGDDVYAVTSKLNALFASKGMTLSASTDGSQLTIAGSKYGSAASYTVAYSRDDAVAGTSTPVSTSPIGFSAGSYAGLDVQGKIYTRGGTPPADVVTGTGQLLTGATGTDADGLSVTYAGSGTGVVGDLSFVVGAAGMMERIARSYTSPGDGVISLQLTSLSDAVTALQKRQTDAQARVTSYQNSLVKQFTAMETAMSQFQSTAGWLTSQINGINAMQAAQ